MQFLADDVLPCSSAAKHSYWISNCSGSLKAQGLFRIATLVTFTTAIPWRLLCWTKLGSCSLSVECFSPTSSGLFLLSQVSVGLKLRQPALGVPNLSVRLNVICGDTRSTDSTSVMQRLPKWKASLVKEGGRKGVEEKSRKPGLWISRLAEFGSIIEGTRLQRRIWV